MRLVPVLASLGIKMGDTVFSFIFLGLAGVVLPGCYLALCAWMFLRKVWWFTYFAYFCLFGALGGWFFALGMSPSGLTASSIVFLISVVLFSCLASSLILQFRKQKTRFEKIAMIGGYVYPLLIGTFFVIIAVLSRP